MHPVIGKGGISATIIQDSITYDKDGLEYPPKSRLTTLELTYPRFIHSEFMTHRMLSKNAASSRAIPVESMIELVRTLKQSPISWGRNQSGMQAKEELNDDEKAAVIELWDEARHLSCDIAYDMHQLQAHKQIVNRILEPFTQMKVVCSGTEFENFFWLRNHPDAQPEIQELARVMLEAMEGSDPFITLPGEYHVPYVHRVRADNGDLSYLGGDGEPIQLADAIVISASCCAQVSYRKNDDSLEKARKVYDRLIGSAPVHASPIEHQATPMEFMDYLDTPGVTHVSKNGSLWSGNFRGWIQRRQLTSNHSKMDI